MAIAVIRIKGLINIEEGMKETLHRLRLRRKYNCIIMPENEESMKILKKIRSFVAYGKISDETLKKLIEERAEPVPGSSGKSRKINAEAVMKEIKSGKTESIKAYFRLHPPRGGIKSKIHFPRGVLGDNGDKINNLIARML